MTKDQRTRDGMGGQDRPGQSQGQGKGQSQGQGKGQGRTEARHPGQDDRRRGDDATADSEKEIGSGHKQSRSEAPNAQGVQPEIGGRGRQDESQNRQTGKGGQFAVDDEMDSEQDELGKGSGRKRR